MRHKLLVYPVLVVTLLGLAACQTPAKEQQGGSKTEAGYSTAKPGAPVALEYAIQGEPALGTAASVELTVTSASAADTLQISLTGDEGLEIAPEEAAVQFTSVEPGVAQTHLINVTPQREGRLFINVFVTVDQAGRQAVRTFAIPLQVGPEVQPQQAPEVRGEDGERIISLPAQES